MQPLQERLFRKVALERLSSPEQLDQLMRVISPLGWLALIPLLGLILMAVLWGWYGSVSTKVAGKCVLISPAGLADVTSLSVYTDHLGSDVALRVAHGSGQTLLTFIAS